MENEVVYDFPDTFIWNYPKICMHCTHSSPQSTCYSIVGVNPLTVPKSPTFQKYLGKEKIELKRL
jgi:hypothetical protein